MLVMIGPAWLSTSRNGVRRLDEPEDFVRMEIEAEVLGDASRELTHRYRGQLKAGELHFVLESSGGQSPHTPVEFIAQRTSK